MDYKSLAADLVKKCLNKGADAAEVYIQDSRNLSINIRNGNIEKVEEAASHGVGFRVFVQGRMAFSSCNDLSEGSLDRAAASAVDFAGKTTPDENNVLPDDKGITQIDGLFDPEISNVSMDRKIELAKEVEGIAMSDKRITKSGGARYFEGENEIFLANSNDLLKSYKSSGCGYGVSVVAEKDDQKCTG
ncbi:PmbA/TldA family metallopeptidase, partial [candidate division KSB1 bacterium]